MKRGFLALLPLVLAVSGCITTPNTMAPEAVASFKLASVSVSFPADANLNYTPAEDDFARSKGVSPGDVTQVRELIRTPEGVAFIRDRAAAKMQDAFKREVGPLLRGVTPVRIEVAVKVIDIPGAARSILLGGTAMLEARISLVDVATGQVINALPSQSEAVGRAGGLIGTAVQTAMEDSGSVAEPYRKLSDKLAVDYGEWLFQRRSGV